MHIPDEVCFPTTSFSLYTLCTCALPRSRAPHLLCVSSSIEASSHPLYNPNATRHTPSRSKQLKCQGLHIDLQLVGVFSLSTVREAMCCRGERLSTPRVFCLLRKQVRYCKMTGWCLAYCGCKRLKLLKGPQSPPKEQTIPTKQGAKPN